MAYVLILEDDRNIASLLREVLQAEGHRCFVLRSKATAERFLRRVRPDLIVADYELADGSGTQPAQMASEAAVAVIMTSGYPIEDEVTALGFAFLQKPFRIAELSALAARLLQP